MKTFAWLKSLAGRVSGRSAPRPIRHVRRLRLEVLEDRVVPSSSPAAAASYGSVPLAFEANQGQTASQVSFLSRGSGYGLFLTPGEAVLSLHSGKPAAGAGAAQAPGVRDEVLHLQLVGADPAATVTGLNKLEGTSNYFLGNDPSQWHTAIPNYGKVEYKNVYDGVNLIYYGNQRQLEYDFVVAPGADTRAITLNFQGAEDVTLDSQGNLVLHTASGDLVEHAPVLYQEVGGIRQAVDGHYVLEGDHRVGFEVGAYDHNQTLVIDPVLSYSTYLGGSGNDTANGIAMDAAGNAYITGQTTSSDFPTTSGAFQGMNRAAPNSNVFVSKLDPTGTRLVYSTYLGGTSSPGDFGYAIAVDASGNAYVTGAANSRDFPTTQGAFQATSGPVGGAFVTKLNATGSALLYSTYLHGSYVSDQGNAIALDASGDAYVTGSTGSSDFPTTATAFQSVWPGAGAAVTFVSKLDATGSKLLYSTFLGGSTSYQDTGNGIAVDSSGNAYVAGSTFATDFPTTPGSFQPGNANFNGVAFVTKLNAGGSGLIYSTYLAGTNGYNDYATAITVDAAGSAYVAGVTQATDFPTTTGAFQRTYGGLQDAFVTKLNPSGSALVYSTYLGGNDSDTARGIAVDGSGNAYVTGQTSSTNFPTRNPVQATFGGYSDAFVTGVNANGSVLVYSSYLGGSGNDGSNAIALDKAGNVYVAGSTTSTNFPTTPGAFQQTNRGGSDAFVAKISSAQAMSLVLTGAPSAMTAGGVAGFTVTARNADGTTATGYTGTVHFSSSDVQAGLPANYTFTTADAGVHTFSATLKTAGTQSITATDAGTAGITGSEAGTVVNPAAASQLSVSAPAGSTAGSAFGVTVTARDAYNNTATGYTGTVHFTSSDGKAALPANYTFTAADAGAHAFSAILKTAGTQSISVKDTVTAGLTGSDGGITVNPAAASQFIISAPSSVTAGVAFSLTVTVEDAYGNVVTGYVGTIHFSSTDNKATLPANYTFTAADKGVHTFTGLVLRKKGKQTLTITDTLTTSLTGSVGENVL